MSKKVKVDELVINGTTYVPKESVNKIAEKLDGMDYVIVRGDRSGSGYGSGDGYGSGSGSGDGSGYEIIN